MGTQVGYQMYATCRLGCESRSPTVYGYTLLAGTVLGAVAGVPGLSGHKGYASKLVLSSPKHRLISVFIVGRIIIGFGLASFLMTSLAILQEITHPRSRSLVVASWDSYWILGQVISSWTNFGCSYITTSWQWRIPYIIQVLPAVYILVAVQFVPETPRFMISKGKHEEALKFLVDYHGNGDPDDPLVLYEFDEIMRTLQAEKEAKAEKWSVILSKPSNRHRLGLAILMQYCIGLSGCGYFRSLLRARHSCQPQSSTITTVRRSISLALPIRPSRQVSTLA